MYKSKNAFLFILFSGIFSLSTYLFLYTPLGNQIPFLKHLSFKASISREQPPALNQVLGDRTPQIDIRSSQKDYSYGGVISLASTDDPVLKVSSYNASGPAKVHLYQSDSDKLLKYITYTQEGKQKYSDSNVFMGEPVATTDIQLQSGYEPINVSLPLEESGIWFAQVEYNGYFESAFIVRSKNGVVVAEGDNELIFWAQNFSSKRSVSGGELEIYTLKNESSKILSTSFGSEGVTKTPMTKDADIALARIDGDISLIPINLQSISDYSYDYKPYAPAEKRYSFFSFTDKPLYKPGDTVNFKSIVRTDDDGHYSIPSGTVTVQIFKDWDQKDTIFKQIYDISPDGTIFGAIPLPDTIEPRSYNIQITTDNNQNSYAYFQVENYRKPEYFIEVKSNQSQLTAGDKGSFVIKAEYFSGQPVSTGEVKYKIYASKIGEYQYASQRHYEIDDKYRYGYYYGDQVDSGTAALDEQGTAQVDFDTVLSTKESSSNKIYSIEVEYDNGAGAQLLTVLICSSMGVSSVITAAACLLNRLSTKSMTPLL